MFWSNSFFCCSENAPFLEMRLRFRGEKILQKSRAGEVFSMTFYHYFFEIPDFEDLLRKILLA
jgi:hypothetical protein